MIDTLWFSLAALAVTVQMTLPKPARKPSFLGQALDILMNLELTRSWLAE
jgi:hypothetical protein